MLSLVIVLISLMQDDRHNLPYIQPRLYRVLPGCLSRDEHRLPTGKRKQFLLRHDTTSLARLRTVTKYATGKTPNHAECNRVK
jgi:hypothetical protein